MLLGLFILGLCGFATAEVCEMSDWSSWGECRTPNHCITPQDHSWSAPAPEVDHAHQRMIDMMSQKKLVHMLRRQCQLEGKCPELNSKPSSGPIPCSEGMAGEWPCENVDLISFTNISDLGYVPLPGDSWIEGNDLWAWTDPQDGTEYVIFGLTGGSSFVRISDPENPEVLGMLYSSLANAAIWRDMKVKNNHAYIVAESANHGMQVFDMTRLRGLTADRTRVFEADFWYREIGNSHNIVANDDTDFVYIVGATDPNYPNRCGRGGLHMVDVSEPKNPQFVGCYADDGYVHDAQCVIYHGPHEAYQDHEICFCYNEDSLTILDVTDKELVVMLSREEYAGSQYTHQGWLTEDHTLALMDDELDEQRNEIKETRTMLWDVTDLTAPVLRASHYSHHQATDHNQYVLGDFTYQANYEAGLQILHINQGDPPSLTFAASFDVWPTRTTPSMFGAWSTYPYLASGVVPLSSIEYGLFLVKPDWHAINALLDSGEPYTEQARFRHVVHAQEPGKCPPRAEVRRCQVNSEC